MILDEPTNYLDLPSLEALEEILRDYQGTLWFVSHDRRFVDAVADRVLVIQEGQLKAYEGNYSQYVNHLANRVPAEEADREEQIMRLEYRRSELLGRLSSPTPGDSVEKLDEEFRQVVAQIQTLKRLK